MSTKEIIDELIEISEAKHRYLSITLGVQKKLSVYIKQDKTQNIAKQIELKDRYLSETKKLDMNFYNLFNKLKSSLKVDSIDKIDVKSYPQMKELKIIVGNILKLSEEIEIIDNQNIKMIKGHMGEMSNRLRGIKQGRSVTNAYKAQNKLIKPLSANKKNNNEYE